MKSVGAEVRDWVVAFAGSRDGYQVPIALVEARRLAALVTDWYVPLDRWWLKALMRVMPLRIRQELHRRFRAALPSSLVRSLHWRKSISLAKRESSEAMDTVIGKYAGTLARRRNHGLLAYSYYAHSAFTAAGPDVPKLIFQVHPHPDALRRLFTEEMTRVPECRDSLASEVEMVSSSERLTQLREEPALADFCLVASRFTKRTLEESGISSERIRVLPYGVDLERFPFSPGPSASSPFRVLFVGQMVQRKGLKYLLDAWRELALPNSELILAGRGRTDREMLSRYAGSFQAESHVSPARLRELYATSDVFCMPSLAEGFGLVYLESLASGTPVIGTRNTGAADIVTEGRDGFILDIRDVAGLRDRLAWCHANRPALRDMRASARATAERCSWENFRRGVVDTLDEVYRARG